MFLFVKKLGQSVVITAHYFLQIYLYFLVICFFFYLGQHVLCLLNDLGFWIPWSICSYFTSSPFVYVFCVEFNCMWLYDSYHHPFICCNSIERGCFGIKIEMALKSTKLKFINNISFKKCKLFYHVTLSIISTFNLQGYLKYKL